MALGVPVSKGHHRPGRGDPCRTKYTQITENGSYKWMFLPSLFCDAQNQTEGAQLLPRPEGLAASPQFTNECDLL